MLAWILVGGRLVLTPALAALPRPHLVVAADGGVRHAAALDVQVDAWVGDFDSSDGLTLDAPREVHPAAKDSTDFELAVSVARERGATELIILGAFGGRFDHAFALAMGACRLAGEGLKVVLHSGNEAGYPLLPSSPVHLALQTGQTFSVLAASPLRGLTLRGARWPLTGVDVPMGSGLTVSNEAAGGLLSAELQGGVALLTVLSEVRRA
ncbi:thiamine diphosphokinase [Deinococcus psychrotolerans]|uniref:Thiamine diphosphokinase n=1 Tax=Deinococcus psychrotolerans TaxID=2489213 RepID=A0A3G8YA21_9DEIO|nr:thiamine diphosphokinase [Deinococcus psychrotolerans]AZI42202.1 thiamine diphosphokinase [Deinococcus psychrotolerans]